MITEWADIINYIWAYKVRPADAIFAHAWGDLRDESIEYIAKIKKESGAKFIILNGLENYELGEPGFSYWKKKLILRL